MKTKNTILGIFAIVLAAGSAFASLLTPGIALVKARAVCDGPITCFNTGITCDDPGQFVCKIQISVLYGSNTTTKTYKDPICTMLLTGRTPDAVVSTESICELVEF